MAFLDNLVNSLRGNLVQRAMASTVDTAEWKKAIGSLTSNSDEENGPRELTPRMDSPEPDYATVEPAMWIDAT